MVIVGMFLLYYLLVILAEKKLISNPTDILDKFLTILLLYVGISLVYYSITGKPFLDDTPEAYSVYVFLIGFISIVWAIPSLLKEFSFFKIFNKKEKKK